MNVVKPIRSLAILAIVSACAGSAVADLISSRNALGLDRLIDDPEFYTPAPLSPGIFGAAPKVETARMSVVQAAAVPAGGQMWTWSRLDSAAAASQTARDTRPLLYAPGIRSTLVSWAAFTDASLSVPGNPPQNNNTELNPPNQNQPNGPVVTPIGPEGPVTPDNPVVLPDPGGPVAVPSPSAGMLALLGVSGLAAVRRRIEA